MNYDEPKKKKLMTTDQWSILMVEWNSTAFQFSSWQKYFKTLNHHIWLWKMNIQSNLEQIDGKNAHTIFHDFVVNWVCFRNDIFEPQGSSHFYVKTVTWIQHSYIHLRLSVYSTQTRNSYRFWLKCQCNLSKNCTLFEMCVCVCACNAWSVAFMIPCWLVKTAIMYSEPDWRWTTRSEFSLCRKRNSKSTDTKQMQW